jgi:hypothetical protein
MWNDGLGGGGHCWNWLLRTYGSYPSLGSFPDRTFFSQSGKDDLEKRVQVAVGGERIFPRLVRA